MPSAAELAWIKLRQLARGRLRELRGVDRRQVRLLPPGPASGRALLSYVLDPFLAAPGQVSHDHTHDWESLEWARALLERGYEVDVVSWANRSFEPSGAYDLLIDARYNLERLARATGPRTLRVLHADTARIAFHNAAEQARLDALEARRGVRLKPRRRLAPADPIQIADCATVLGNEFTLSTYRDAGKPLYRVPISSTLRYDWPEARDLASARRRFLWLGSGGMVHKGLDLVLEAFAGAPELELWICGPVLQEADFVRAYRRELFELPNVHLVGWIDTASPAFRELAQRCLGSVYPSCSEGGGGSVIGCMHAGLVPIVTREASVDVEPGFGVLLPDAALGTLREALRELSRRPVSEARELARRAYLHVREHHTRESFARDLRLALERIHAELGNRSRAQGESGAATAPSASRASGQASGPAS